MSGPMDGRHDRWWHDSDEVLFWLRRVITIIGFGFPVAFVVLSILSGLSRDETIWNGIMGFMLGMIFMYGTAPQMFSLFPPGRRRRRRE